MYTLCTILMHYTLYYANTFDIYMALSLLSFSSAGILRSVSPIPNGSPNPNCVLNGHGLSIQKGAVKNTQHIHTSAHAHSHAPGHTASLWASALSSAANTSGECMLL